MKNLDAETHNDVPKVFNKTFEIVELLFSPDELVNLFIGYISSNVKRSLEENVEEDDSSAYPLAA